MTFHLTGYSGGKGAGLRTTTLWQGHDALIDAGAGVRALDSEDIARMDYAVVTYTHLDHVASLPFVAYTAGVARERPIAAHSLPEAIDNRRSHLFNPELWPDFSEISDANRQSLRYASFPSRESVTLDHCRAGPVRTNHVLCAMGCWPRSWLSRQAMRKSASPASSGARPA